MSVNSRCVAVLQSLTAVDLSYEPEVESEAMDPPTSHMLSSRSTIYRGRIPLPPDASAVLVS